MELHVEPRVVKNWDQFTEQSPNRSIALDGYVYGKPRFRQNGTYANFNHHEQVDRLATRSTAAQVMVAIKQGLMDAFTLEDGKIDGHIYVNDADQDTCLAIWLLKNHERIEGFKNEPLINNLITIEDLLDVTAGSYPLNPKSKSMKKVARIFEPYILARNTGFVFKMDEYEMRRLIDTVISRINKYIDGKGKEIVLDTSYQKIGGGTNWSMIIEQGAHARGVFLHDGIKAYVAFRDENEGAYIYSIGRISPYIDFPIGELYQALNEAEGITDGCNDCWGGSNIIGGSPREHGSFLSPKEVENVINDTIEKINEEKKQAKIIEEEKKATEEEKRKERAKSEKESKEAQEEMLNKQNDGKEEEKDV